MNEISLSSVNIISIYNIEFDSGEKKDNITDDEMKKIVSVITATISIDNKKKISIINKNEATLSE